jgi:site-specific recombinase XerD
MPTTEVASTTISVFTRHSGDCDHADDNQYKRCDCRKSLYIYENGNVTYKSAKTRSWAQAEKLAQAEWDLRDPVKIELQKIAEREAPNPAAELSKMVPLAEALQQWLGSNKSARKVSMEAYRSTTRRILRWAHPLGVTYVSDITPELLSKWHSDWSPDSDQKENRIKLTTQAALLVRIKAFFEWAVAIGYIQKSPALMLKAITSDDSQTKPLTPGQFDELLKATERLDAEARYESAKIGQQLRAVFLVQRWTGLRIGDVVKLPKAVLRGNLIRIDMQKTGDTIECVVPDNVVNALNALPLRKEEHPDYWLWSRKCSALVNTNKWIRKVRHLNKYLSFRDEDGEPMEFRSHMLRDMFAVEMLLAGVPLENVSKLLGHRSIAVTERYYAKWVKARQRKLQGEVIQALRKMGATVRGD